MVATVVPAKLLVAQGKFVAAAQASFAGAAVHVLDIVNVPKVVLPGVV